MDYWNKTNLTPPPTCCLAYKREEIPSDFDKLLGLLDSASSHLLNQDALGSEMFILSRVIYKINCQFRQEKTLQRMKQVDKCLNRFLNLNLYGLFDIFSQSFPRLEDFQQELIYVPSRQMLECLLVSLQGAAHVMAKTLSYCHQLHLNIIQHLRSGFFIPNNVLYTAVVSRIWILCQSLLRHLVDWYRDLRTWVPKFKKAASEWLPVDVCLPEDLEQLIHDTPKTEIQTAEKSDKEDLVEASLPPNNAPHFNILGTTGVEDIGEPLGDDSLIKQLYSREHCNRVASDNMEDISLQLTGETSVADISRVKSSKLKQKRKLINEKELNTGEIYVVPSKKAKLKRGKMAKFEESDVLNDVSTVTPEDEVDPDASKEYTVEKIETSNKSDQDIAALDTRNQDIQVLLQLLKASKDLSDLKNIKDRAMHIHWLPGEVKDAFPVIQAKGTVHAQKIYKSKMRKIRDILKGVISRTAPQKDEIKPQPTVGMDISYIQEKVTDYATFVSFLKDLENDQLSSQGCTTLDFQKKRKALKNLMSFYKKKKGKDPHIVLPVVQEKLMNILQRGKIDSKIVVNKPNQEEEIKNYLERNVTDYPSFMNFLQSLKNGTLPEEIFPKCLNASQSKGFKKLKLFYGKHKEKKRKPVLSVVRETILDILHGNKKKSS